MGGGFGAIESWVLQAQIGCPRFAGIGDRINIALKSSLRARGIPR